MVKIHVFLLTLPQDRGEAFDVGGVAESKGHGAGGHRADHLAVLVCHRFGEADGFVAGVSVVAACVCGCYPARSE